MLSLELITEYITALENFGESDKAEIQELFSFLEELKVIDKRTMVLKELVRKLIRTNKIDKYVELNGTIIDLETANSFDLIPVNPKALIEITKLDKKIRELTQSLDDYIDAQNQVIENLIISKEKLLDNVFSDTKNKAIQGKDIYILQDSNGDRQIIYKD